MERATEEVLLTAHEVTPKRKFAQEVAKFTTDTCFLSATFPRYHYSHSLNAVALIKSETNYNEGCS